jgi:undecaprenyl pyrophosphate phosphatase UppP
VGGFDLGLILAGSISAIISGIISMKVLMHIVKNKTLYWFVGYRVALAAVLILFLV